MKGRSRIINTVFKDTVFKDTGLTSGLKKVFLEFTVS